MRTRFLSPSFARFGRRASSTAAPLSGLKINSDRLAESLHYTCQWGAAHRYGEGPTETGMARLALNDDDARVRKWFSEEMTEKLGCDLKVDQMGNMFARRRGRSSSTVPMTAMGSHLDTQPRGGRYDGILGVLAAVEAIRTMEEAGYKTHFDVGVVNWTNEEGARFPGSMVSSGVWAGGIPLEKAWDLADIFDSSVTMKSELERHGYLGELECSHKANPLGAHFELHIEQSTALEATGRKIGVVQGAQAYRWFTITITGRDSHTGTTALSRRRDPVLAMSRMIATAHAIAADQDALATTGVIKMPTSSSTNTIASEVTFTLDIRHPEDSVVAEVQQKCLKAFDAISKQDGRGVEYKWSIDVDSAAVKFDRDCVAAVESAAHNLVGADGWMPLTSGAGHDSVYTSKHCPTTMIFVPCRDGVSHHPTEYSSQEDCAIGAQALLEAVVSYDRLRERRGY